MSPANCVAVVDGGTTNTRARLLEDGRIVAVARRSIGVRDAALAGDASNVADAVRGCLDELVSKAGRTPDLILVIGMLTSDSGLVGVPHATAPASVFDLASAAVARVLPRINPAPMLFIPGVRTPAGPGADGWTEADVMRGEECETLGAWRALGLSSGVVFVWPGSHTKLVAVDGDGQITASWTSLAGEMAEAIARHTLLAASLGAGPPDAPDPDAVAEGARAGRIEGLGRAAFLVRVADLNGRGDAAWRAAFWLGAVVAVDVDHLLASRLLVDRPAIWVGGRDPLRALYGTLIAQRYSGCVTVLEAEMAEAAGSLGSLLVAGHRR
jgi:2-dehydro-3-deoxygalactonokinase